MIWQKPEGSLAKWPRRTGMRGSDPSDRDVAAQIKRDRDLIGAVGFGSGG